MAKSKALPNPDSTISESKEEITNSSLNVRRGNSSLNTARNTGSNLASLATTRLTPLSPTSSKRGKKRALRIVEQSSSNPSEKYLPPEIVVDPNHKWCVYRTSHPTGFFYLGKGLTQKVLSGAYKGSGVKLKAAFLHMPSNEWTSEVLCTFASEFLIGKKDPGERRAYDYEKHLVTFDVISSPYCLNSVAGGVGGWKWKILSASSVAKRAKAISDALKGQKRGPQKQSTVEKRQQTLLSPEVASKLGDYSRGKKFPERGAALSAASKNWVKGTCPHCGGTFSPSPLARYHGDNCKKATPTQ